ALRPAGGSVTAGGLAYATRIDGTDIVLQVRNASGELILDESQPRHPRLLGDVCEFDLLAEEDGSDVAVTLTVTRDGVRLQQIADELDDRALSRVAKAWMGVLADDISYRMLGHITVVGSAADPWVAGELSAVDGFTGERAAERVVRLCGEENLPVRIV